MPMPERPPLATVLVAVLAGAKLALHLVVNAVTPYGFHRDEFLYLAMGRHLQLWRMDFPPGIALLAEATRGVLGDSLLAIRTAPALAGVALVVLAALLARELGGGRWAQGLAAAAPLASPLFLRAANLFQPVVLDQLLWTAALYALARICRSGEQRWWVALGAAIGAGLLTKFSIGFLGVALLPAILLSSQRRALLTPWPWIGVTIALAIGSPSVVGQVRLGFPVLGQMADLRASQLDRVTPTAFVLGQFLWGPITLLALAGVAALLRAERFRVFRPVGWTCVGAFVVLLLLRGKPYYLGPVYPTLCAAGAVLLEGVRPRRLGTSLRWSTVALVVAFGIVTLPLGVPILPPSRMAAYAQAIGATPALRTNTGQMDQLPQDYADMLGWEEQVATVAEVYHALPPADRARAVIVGGNYGEAGAIDFFGPRLGLPAAVSPAGSYWFFGPGQKPGEVVVTIGPSREQLIPLFESVRAAARVVQPWAVEEERDLTVHVATNPRQTLQEIWPSLAGQN
ncbi:MAG: glycosyltransferase family 39 protein [Gemmatimonadales bacterium]|nr:glycosyltransferase family 39 protein [Gemmatimonadales bacterium]